MIRGSRKPHDPVAALPEQHLVHSTGRSRAMDLLFGEDGAK